MISYKKERNIIAGLSTDAKPIDVSNGSKFFEMDTGVWFIFDEENTKWYKLLSSSEDEDVLTTIAATFDSTANITNGNSLEDLKPYLTVTEVYKSGATNVVSDYALSGALTVGQSPITVVHSGLATTFDVSVTDQKHAIYSLPSAKEFDGTSTYIDTGLKLMQNGVHSFTVVFDMLDKARVATSGDRRNISILHCMHEISPWVGFGIQENYYGSDNTKKKFKLDLNTETSKAGFEYTGFNNTKDIRVKIAYIVDVEAGAIRLIADIDGTEVFVIKYLPSDVNGINLDESLLIGCYQTADGTKGRFWTGTMYDLKVYNYALTESEVKSYMETDHS